MKTRKILAIAIIAIMFLAVFIGTVNEIPWKEKIKNLIVC